VDEHGARSPMIFLRSLLFNLAFYVVTAVMLVATLPLFFILPQAFGMSVVRNWAKASVFLHEKIAGVRVEVRGAENLPKGAALIAPKHQSSFETFALIPLLKNPTIVMKRSLRWLPIFGQYTIKTGMIHVDREGKTSALRALAERAREEIAKGREIIIFPEGRRRAPGAPPDYQPGIALLYRTLNVPVVPVALNSGLYWPRRQFLHHPGTIVVEFLPAIPPGLDLRTFLTKLQTTIETASARLIAEGQSATRKA
jgi:1-acyl-sn-glycerol-3-phosphate acyltransferase